MGYSQDTICVQGGWQPKNGEPRVLPIYQSTTFKYATSEIIRFAFLMTDESLTSLAKKVPDLLDYTDNNGLIDYNGDVNGQLYKLFGMDNAQQQYIKEVLSTKIN